MHAAHNFFHKEGYISITTPKIVAAATEGGTELFPIVVLRQRGVFEPEPAALQADDDGGRL